MPSCKILSSNGFWVSINLEKEDIALETKEKIVKCEIYSFAHYFDFFEIGKNLKYPVKFVYKFDNKVVLIKKLKKRPYDYRKEIFGNFFLSIYYKGK